MSAVTKLHRPFAQSNLSSNIRTFRELNSAHNSAAYPCSIIIIKKEVDTDKIRCISAVHGERGEDCRVASGRIKTQEFYSPASVFCVLGPKGDLGLCIFLIVICGGTIINGDLCSTNQWRTAAERNLSC